MSEDLDNEIVRLAVMAAGTADRGWQERVTGLVPRIAVLFREPNDPADPNALTNIARKTTEASSFRAEYRDHRFDENTQRIFVRLYDEKNQDGDFLDDEGCQTVRTEPMWSQSGRVIRKTIEAMTSGQRAIFYRYSEQIDKKRKQGLLVHLEPLGSQSRSVTPDRTPKSVQAPERPAGDAARPASPATSHNDKRIAEIEIRYEKLGPVWRVRFAKQCNIELGVLAALMPPDDKVDDVLRVLGEIETESEKA